MKREEQLALKKVEYEGKVYPTKSYGDILVLEYINYRDVTIKFLNTGNARKTATSEMRKGEIRDNEAFPVYKMGVMDITNELRRGQPKPREYSILEWCNNQIGFDQDGWYVDKDLLFKGNKVYSAETCVLLPQQINTLITGANAIRGDLPKGVYYDKSKGISSRYRARVSQDNKYVCCGSYSNPEDAWLAYKEAKESWVKVVAERWKDKIDPRVYEALMKWEISIDD